MNFLYTVCDGFKLIVRVQPKDPKDETGLAEVTLV